jgi:phytol kinase
MISIGLSLGLIFVLLVVSEVLWRRGSLQPETARKLIHILVGTFIAFWPLYMSWQTIQLLSVALFVGVFISYRFGVFGAIHRVKRRSAGELWYPVGIGLSALATIQPWVFALAILHVSLADGLAAVTGTRWGRSSRYRIGTHTKSLIGSFTFLVISFALCMFAYIFLGDELPGVSLAVFAVLPFLATAVESISRHGLDNVFVPLSVIFALGLPTGTLVFSSIIF